MGAHLLDALLFLAGFAAAAVTLGPFSPMTIDWILVSRETQVTIYRRRHLFWGVAFVCLVGLVARGALGWAATPVWMWAALGTAALLLMMFWGGYVPFVMNPPGVHRVLAAVDAEQNVHVRPEDVVLGVQHGGEARAYLRDQIARPHFFNDDIAGRRLTVSYCILCNSAMAFRSELGGRPLDLHCVTANNNNIIYRDATSDNYIQQLDGSVFAGPDAGAVLEPHPVTLSTWGEWRRLHPETKLYDAPPTSFRDKMVAWMLSWMVPITKLVKRRTPFHRLAGKADERLPAMSYVLGVERGRESCAYALDPLCEKPVVNDTVGGEQVAIFFSAERDMAQVFAREIDGRELHFRCAEDEDSEVVAVDEETGSGWDLDGVARSGELAGRKLEPVAHYNKLFWFSWAFFKPGTRVVAAAL